MNLTSQVIPSLFCLLFCPFYLKLKLMCGLRYGSWWWKLQIVFSSVKHKVQVCCYGCFCSLLRGSYDWLLCPDLLAIVGRLLNINIHYGTCAYTWCITFIKFQPWWLVHSFTSLPSPPLVDRHLSSFYIWKLRILVLTTKFQCNVWLCNFQLMA